MKMDLKIKKPKPGKIKQELIQNIFLIILLIISAYVWFLGGFLNNYFNGMLSSYRIIIQDLRIPFLSVVIAPIDEEIVKFLGYIAIYLFGTRLITYLKYDTKKEFIDDYILVAFLISVGGFGLFEGINHNLGHGATCLISFVALNILIHITFSIYPYLLGRKYHNWFFLFLPIGMAIHSIHNFIIDFIWDNKWVTLIMVSFLLLPIIFMKGTNFYKILERFTFEESKNPRRVNFVLSILFILLYIYIILCVWLRFL